MGLGAAQALHPLASCALDRQQSTLTLQMLSFNCHLCATCFCPCHHLPSTQYVFIGVSELLAVAGSLELFYSQASLELLMD